MRIGRHLRLLAVIAALGPAAAWAQDSHVALQISERGVTLDARGATLQDVLAEWTRVGGLRVLKAEGLDNRSITLQLSNVSEREALNALLRDVAGFVLSARAAGEKGLSEFGSLVIVGSSSPVASSARPAVAPATPQFFFDDSGFQATAVREALPVASARPARPSQAQDVALAGRTDAPPLETGSDTGGGQATPAIPLVVPETPLFRPSPAPDAANPFGRVPGAVRPGEIVPGGPPPGVVNPARTDERTPTSINVTGQSH